MRRRLAPAVFAALVALSCGTTRLPAPRVDRPHVLLVMLDRVGSDIGAYGGEAETPHLDRLASRGRRFERAYAQYPSLVASRLSILTGGRPERTRLVDDLPSRDALEGLLPLPEAFHAKGYFTARVGRLVGGSSDAPFVWDRVDEPGPEVVGKRAQEVLAERPDRPLFLAVSFESGDPRRLPPAEFVEAYDPRRIRLPPPGDRAGLPPLALADAGKPQPATAALPEDQRRRQRVAELARISQIDAQVGGLLDALDGAGLGERTVVVVVGDTAASLGWPRRDVLFEEALRAALIVAGPGVGAP
ncbi:MAG TPA: sulfatase-like hydrolase/transferase, partial [Vicinamibacteria bacterium]